MSMNRTLTMSPAFEQSMNNARKSRPVRRFGGRVSDRRRPVGTVRPMRLNAVRRGSGAPIVFIHGMGMSAGSWEAGMDQLADGYTVVAIDLLGHGASPVPEDPAEYTRDRALDDIDDVLGELLSDVDTPAVLVGHSLGGYLALAYAATRSDAVRGVVVINTGPGYRDPVKREEWNARSKRNAHRFGVPEQVTTLNLQDDSVVMDRLGDMKTPTLVLAGSEDRPEYTGAGEYLERKMPDARLVVVAGGGHSMHEDSHAAEVAELIRNFVTGLDG
jgi:pimeloyl-ACP methyl ester carboxylesterase